MKSGYGWFEEFSGRKLTSPVNRCQMFNRGPRVDVSDWRPGFDLPRKECAAPPEMEKDGIPPQLLFVQDQLLSHCV